jgi:hypothetical protein
LKSAQADKLTVIVARALDMPDHAPVRA